MNSCQSLAAIILAAGYSSRMHGFKPLLPFGDATVIEQTVRAFRQAGIEDITVVTGYRAHDLTPILEQTGVKWVYNEKYSEGMYSSIVAGLKSLYSSVEACFLLPADMPLVKCETIIALLKAYEQENAAVVYPASAGRRGHPPLISAKLFPKIISWQGQGGLRQFLAQYETQAVELAVSDSTILLDADTPAEYMAICRLFTQHCVAKF